MKKKNIGEKIEVSEICFGTSALGNMPDTYGYEVDLLSCYLEHISMTSVGVFSGDFDE